MADDRASEVARLKAVCIGLIDELATLGGEKKLFNHYQESVAGAAERGELEDLMQIWSDLKDWSRVLSPKQRQLLEARVRQRFGVDLADDDS